jgi:2-polyprenyl-3-methyl-5-hydroxy-6-metoxy-1,4-benzoquinol methylase
MSDSNDVTKALCELYKPKDIMTNLNFYAFMHFSGISTLPKCSKILDCGCATGNFLSTLEDHGFIDLYGLDASSEMVEYARKVIKARIFCSDALHLSSVFKNYDFDAVIAMNLQHHLGYEREWELFIGECRNIIKTKGLLFIREPYPSFLFNSLRWMTGHSIFFKIRLLRSRLQSLVEEKELLYYFLDKWPGYYKECLQRNGFDILRESLWMGHRILAAQAR